MKAIGFNQNLAADHPQALVDIEVDYPRPETRDIIVQVSAIAVNPVDTKVRRKGDIPENGYRILGWDVVGTVVALGSGASQFQVGDRVWYSGSLVRPGANSEFHAVDERIVSKAPVNLADAEAAALPLTAITAWELLFDRLGLDWSSPQSGAGQHLLVIGGAGGVGSILIQLARQLTAVEITATASRPETSQWVTDLGAHHVIDHHKPLKEQLTGEPDLVISLTHSEQYIPQLPALMKPQGHFAIIDDPAEPFDVRPFKGKSLSVHWELMFTRSMFQTEDMAKQGKLLAQVAELVENGRIRTTFGRHMGRINAENLMKAHQLLETNTTIGKMVLEGF